MKPMSSRAPEHTDPGVLRRNLSRCRGSIFAAASRSPYASLVTASTAWVTASTCTSHQLGRRHSGSRQYRRDPECSDNLPPCSFAERTAGTHVRKLWKYLLLLESAGSESLQRVVASIRGQNGMRVCTCEICHRGSYASVYGGQKIGVNVALMGPGLHRCHTRDLSPLVDIASRDYEEVGIRGN